MGMGSLKSAEYENGAGHTNSSQQSDVEIMVHIDEYLDENRREQLKAAVEELDGIITIEFCISRFQLMFVAYDSKLAPSNAVLDQVLRQGVHAEIVRPI